MRCVILISTLLVKRNYNFRNYKPEGHKNRSWTVRKNNQQTCIHIKTVPQPAWGNCGPMHHVALGLHTIHLWSFCQFCLDFRDNEFQPTAVWEKGSLVCTNCDTRQTEKSLPISPQPLQTLADLNPWLQVTDAHLCLVHITAHISCWFSSLCMRAILFVVIATPLM